MSKKINAMILGAKNPSVSDKKCMKDTVLVVNEFFSGLLINNVLIYGDYFFSYQP